MAKKYLYVDDLDGTTTTDVTSHRFSLDGDGYEIDLSPENLAALRDALADFIEVARKIRSRDRDPKKKKPGANVSVAPQKVWPDPHGMGMSREERQAMRTWGQKNGFSVADHGRFPKEVVAAYREAHPERRYSDDDGPVVTQL